MIRIGFLPIGAPDRVSDWFEDEIKMGYDSSMDVFVWASAYAGIRQMERFKAYVRAGGKIDHWRARGWPDLCRPMERRANLRAAGAKHTWAVYKDNAGSKTCWRNGTWLATCHPGERLRVLSDIA